jgi:hypothetical protein
MSENESKETCGGPHSVVVERIDNLDERVTNLECNDKKQDERLLRTEINLQAASETVKQTIELVKDIVVSNNKAQSQTINLFVNRLTYIVLIAVSLALGGKMAGLY